LGNQPVQVGETRGRNVEILLADVVNSLIVDLVQIQMNSSHIPAAKSEIGTDHESAVGVLESRVRRKDRVIGLDHGVGHGGSRVDTELQF
jgi:hypothetical protein